MSRGLKNIFLIFVLLLPAGAMAQVDSRSEAIEKQRQDIARSPYVRDDDAIERAVEWFYNAPASKIFRYGWNGIFPVTGGLANNSGFAVGAQYLRTHFWNNNLVLRSSVRASLRKAQLFDAEVGLPRLAGNRMYADFYARHRNLPGILYYGPGPRSARTGGTAYRLEDTTFDASGGVKPTRMLRLGVTGGFLKMNVGPGDDNRFRSTDQIYSPRNVPGLDRQSDFLRGGVLAQFDWRDNPSGPQRGGNYYARYDFYQDRHQLGFTFRRLTAEVQQFLPFTNQKRVFAVRAKTILSYENPGQRIPFYLQPSLGSADDLRGFVPYRFYDNNSLVFNGEYRWEIVSGVDGALFADTGKVFPRPGLMNLARLEHSFGGGFRFRTPKGVYLRLDGAASREGIRVWFVFNDIFATPQVRTGAEISPPPGRLP
jgi:outer membrane protein assembly factor BamA